MLLTTVTIIKDRTAIVALVMYSNWASSVLSVSSWLLVLGRIIGPAIIVRSKDLITKKYFYTKVKFAYSKLIAAVFLCISSTWKGDYTGLSEAIAPTQPDNGINKSKTCFITS